MVTKLEILSSCEAPENFTIISASLGNNAIGKFTQNGSSFFLDIFGFKQKAYYFIQQKFLNLASCKKSAKLNSHHFILKRLFW